MPDAMAPQQMAHICISLCINTSMDWVCTLWQLIAARLVQMSRSCCRLMCRYDHCCMSEITGCQGRPAATPLICCRQSLQGRQGNVQLLLTHWVAELLQADVPL